MTYYRHTQGATVILLTLGAASLVAIFAMVEVRAFLIPLIVLAILGCIALLFASLTVEVSSEAVAIHFGVGLIRRRWAMADIVEARWVRSRWVYGWGIRRTPHGWMYNVSGLKAVELVLKDGSKVWIGTDQPEELLRAIHQAKGMAP